MIGDSLLDIVNTLFKKRSNWIYLTDSQKEKNFFIINRFLSKEFPENANFLNKKNINKAVSMDIWFYYLENKPMPKSFWSKKEKDKGNLLNKKISNEEVIFLMKKYNLNKEELNYAIDKFPEIIKEDLKIKKLKDK